MKVYMFKDPNIKNLPTIDKYYEEANGSKNTSSWKPNRVTGEEPIIISEQSRIELENAFNFDKWVVSWNI